ncbi:hypothetical protein FRB96_005018 [Tulasnella sp. 330]|nr:hypothetical protein FRB96_005018 [Tulasnella sp. 330]KAG8868098.1 hypothetical protein FRB97_002701 [Tulasnella sp. 331]
MTSKATLRSLLHPYTTCEISDAFIKLKHNRPWYIPDIIQYSPTKPSDIAYASQPTNENKICGPAYTVRMVLAVDKQSPTPKEHFVDAIPEGSIVVISSPVPQGRSAVWGGLMTAGAKVRGALGVVIDGRFRDLNEHREAAFPVYARGQSTLGQGTFTRPSELNVPISVGLYPTSDMELATSEGLPLHGPVVIQPGDIMVADADGVVCVPKDMVEDVSERCRIGREVDDKCMEDIKAGKGVAETFKLRRGKL